MTKEFLTEHRKMTKQYKKNVKIFFTLPMTKNGRIIHLNVSSGI